MKKVLTLTVSLLLFISGCQKEKHNHSKSNNQKVLDKTNSFQVPLFFGLEPLAQLSVTQELWDRYSSAPTSIVKAVLRNNQNYNIDSIVYKIYVYGNVNQTTALPIYISTYTATNITPNSQPDSLTLEIPFTQDLYAGLFKIEVISLTVHGVNVASAFSGVYFGSYDIYKTIAPDTIPSVTSQNFVNATIDASGTLRSLLGTTNWDRIIGYIDPSTNFTGSYLYKDSTITGLKQKHVTVIPNKIDMVFTPINSPFTLFDSLVLHLNK